MYIWILLAAIMVALSFFNLSPRADKDHALNEIRAAAVTNRFQVEHEAMLKTMECEIIKRKNNGWDDYAGVSIAGGEGAEGEGEGGSGGHSSTPEPEVISSNERASSHGPVDVSCFNPEVFGRDVTQTKCNHATNAVHTAQDSSNTKMQAFVIADADQGKIKEDYNHFDMHVPYGYDSKPYNVFPKGIHHFIYCLKTNAEEATSEDDFVRCDLRKTCKTVRYEEQKDEYGNITSEAREEEVCEEDNGTSGDDRANAYKRYLVTFAQIPDKWLSKGRVKTPQATFTNMLSKDDGSATVYGWTDCSSTVTEEGEITTVKGSCRLVGLNARNGYVKRADESRRYRDNDGSAVSIDIDSYDVKRTYDEETGEWVDTDPQKAVHQVFEYEVLGEDSVFWQNEEFKKICIEDEVPCLFAYEQFPGADTAYHCHNLMCPDEDCKKTNCPPGKEGRYCRYKMKKAAEENSEQNGSESTGSDNLGGE